MNPKQRHLARHALGLTHKRESYRNHFVTGPGAIDYHEWMQMVKDGYAWRRAGSVPFGGDDLFGLTPTGARAALEQGETLCPEDFPHETRKPRI